MRTVHGRRGWRLPLVPIAAGVVAVISLVALLGVLGIVPIPGLAPRAPSTAGLVAIPISARPIPAYTKITRDDFWDSKAQRLAYIYLPPGQVSPEMRTDLTEIIGRVLERDKAPGYVFTERDFLPQGTRPGLVAGIPPGKRAMRVEAEKVKGLFGLQAGDRFDLVATLPVDPQRNDQALTSAGGIYGPQLSLQAQLQNWRKQATVRVLVQNGVVVSPMSTRQEPVFSRTLTQGGITRYRPVQEVVLAIDPGEVASLTEALAVEAVLTCVPRSGRPGDDETSVTPESEPWSPFVAPGGNPGAHQTPSGASLTMVETIQGSKRELSAVPVR